MKPYLPSFLIAALFLLLSPGMAMADDDCDGYRTQTPGGWGAPANGNNPGTYRDAHFDEAFPDGLTIGCGENTLTLTSAAAVEAYLPCGGPTAVINGSYTDPGCLNNVFTGHLVALTLSVFFDENDEDFSEAEGNLADAVINQGMFEGWTVAEIWQLANEVIGGCNTDYSPNQVKNAIAAINQNFVDGEQNNGYLDCGEEGCPDEDAPVVVYCPGDVTIECNDAIPMDMPMFEDADEDLMISYTEEMNYLECGYELVRTWVATDDCENSASCTQVITVTDSVAPYFTSFPEDATYECDEDYEIMMPGVADDCSEVELSHEDAITPGDCPSEYVLVRVYTAIDACGNMVQDEVVITVVDTTAPALSGYPEDMVVDCDAETPGIPMLTATDNCDESVEVMFSEMIGEGGEEGVCTLTTPMMDSPVWAMVLFSMPGGTQYYTVQNGTFVEFPDNTAQIEVDLVSTTNPTGGFHASVHLINGMTWDEWSNQGFPTDYKDDLGIVVDEYLYWTYYIIDNNNSTLTGWGNLSGSFFTINHAPSSLYYGYQVGDKADNVSDEYGHGGWMSINGQYVNADAGIDQAVTASGDFAFGQSCCNTPSITRTWTATDCAGNSVTHTQVISFADLPEGGLVADGGTGGDLRMLESYPNPTSDDFTAFFVSESSTRVLVQLFNLMGTPVSDVFNGNVSAEQPLRVDLDMSQYANGVYVLRGVSATGQAQVKIVKE